jgi:hypothetical protein
MNIIKNIIIMYFIQNILTDNVRITDNLRDEMRLSIKNDNDIMKIIVSIITKMIDEIILSTLDNIINVGSSHYLRHLTTLNPPLPPRVPPVETLLDGMITNVRELFVKPDNKIVMRNNDIISESVTKYARNMLGRASPINIDFLQIYNAKENNDTK